MSDTLGLGVSVTGIAEAVSALGNVAAATRGVTAATTEHSQAVRDAVREGQVYNFHEQQAAQAAERSAQATRDAAQQQIAATTSAIQFGQRVAGVANAVQALTAQLGGGSHTAGLIGASANTSVQFAQMGAVFGPEGAFVGGIIGAAIPAIHELTAALDGSITVASHAGDSIEQMVSRYTQLQESAALADRFAHGLATVDEQQTAATQAQARYSQELANGVELQNRLNALQREDTTTAERLAGEVIPGLGAALEATHLVRQQEIEDLTSAIAGSQRHAEALREEASAATELTRTMTPLTAAQAAQTQLDALQAQQDINNSDHTLTAPKHRSGGGQSREDRADAATASVQSTFDAAVQGSTATAAQVQTLQEAMQHLWASAYDGAANYQQEQAQLIEQIRALQSADQERADAATQQEHDRLEAVQSLEDAKRKAGEEYAVVVAQEERRARDVLNEENATKAKLHQEAEQRTQQTQQATSEMIGSLTSVFSLLTQGQANAGQAAELLLASFLQYISQRATVEALAQVAMAIGSYPDPAGMALHAAGAVAWGAVAVAAGVGGAALANDAQSQMSAAHGAQAAATTRDTASASHEQASQQGGGQTNFYIYPGGVTTKSDLAALIADAQDHGARNGIVSRAYQRAA